MRYAIVFASGFCALVYQIVWMRLFIRVFGLSVHSTTTVVCAFMLGLGIGSYIAPWVLRKWKQSPWSLYAWLEIGIGITALMIPWSISPITAAYASLGEMESTALLTTFKFVLSVSVMLVPTILMGITLPAIIEGCIAQPPAGRTPDSQSSARTVGYVYGFNTAGAATGCLVVGFVLLYKLGVQQTVMTIVAVNFAVALAAWLIYGRGHSASIDGKPTQLAVPASGEDARLRYSVLFIYCIIGFVSFGLEITWFRILVFYLQSATYSFSILLATYLIGLAGGSLLFSRLLEKYIDARDSFKTTVTWLAAGQLALALITVCTMYVSAKAIPGIWTGLIGAFGADSWFVILMQKFAVASLIILPSTLIMGATFPLCVKLYKQSGSSDAQSVGYLYAANTIGAVLGITITGFVLFDLFGIQKTMSIMSLIALGIGFLVLLMFGQRKTQLVAAGVAGIWLIAIVVIPGNIMISTVEQVRNMRILFYSESASDITMVGQSRTGFNELIYHDGRGTCSTQHAVNYVNRQLAYSAMVQKPDAKKVLVISMGCGNTASTFTAFPIDQLDIVDLSSGVFEAAEYFAYTNKNVLQDPRVRTFTEDGRNFLLTTSDKYDIIQLELPSLHTDGVANLYTREFYELAKSKLTENGVLSQWIDTQQIGREVGYVLINTMQEVFPNTTVWANKWAWWGNGVNGNAQLDYAAFAPGFATPSVVEDMDGVRSNLADILANIVDDPGSVATTVGGRRLITDDDTYVDFEVPRLQIPEALGGGVAYYNSPFAKVFMKSWEESGTFKDHDKYHYIYYPTAEWKSRSNNAVKALAETLPEGLLNEVLDEQDLERRMGAGLPPSE